MNEFLIIMIRPSRHCGLFITGLGSIYSLDRPIEHIILSLHTYKLKRNKIEKLKSKIKKKIKKKKPLLTLPYVPTYLPTYLLYIYTHT